MATAEMLELITAELFGQRRILVIPKSWCAGESWPCRCPIEGTVTSVAGLIESSATSSIRMSLAGC